MSNNADILTEEETFEEMNNSYQLDVVEYDENDEGTVEYLDLDLEVDQIPESAEEYITESRSPKAKLSVQSSVLKQSYKNSGKLKRKQTPKVNRPKQQTAIAPKMSILQIKSTMDNTADSNSTSESAREKMNCLASATVHAAVNVINAKLADSVQSMNGPERNNISNERVEFNGSTNDESEASQMTKSDMKREGDSLDLFFQSMAQTVLHLPPKVQAKIKMDIYKVIAMAEIKYGISNTTQANKL